MDRNMIMVIAVLAVALVGTSAYVIVDENESDGETVSYTWSVSETLSDYAIGTGTYVPSLSGSVPGVTFTSKGTGTTSRTVANGTPTTSGSYTINLYDASAQITTTANITVAQGSSLVVTIAKSPSAGGSVSTTSVTVASGTSFSSTGSTLTIGSTTVTASPASGYTFTGWSPSSGTITSNTTITAYFSQSSTYYTVTISATSGGSVSTTSVTVESGTSFSSRGSILTIGTTSVSATSASGYSFNGWSPSSGYVTSDMTITANFIKRYTVTFAKSPTDGGTISSAEASVTEGTTFTSSGNVLNLAGIDITATPVSGYSFGRWSPSSGTVTSNMTITAVFVQSGTTYTVTITKSTSGGYISTTSVTVESGTSFSSSGSTLRIGSTDITASDTPGCIFSRWSPSSGTVTSSMTITAVFEETTETYTVTITADPVVGGTVSQSSVTGILAGTSFSSSGNTLVIGGSTAITATPREGYTFSGFTPSSGTISAGVKTIRAYFATIPTETTYVLHYDAKGGSGAPPTQTYGPTTESFVIFTIPDTIPTKAGYVFQGWANQGAVVASYQPGETIRLMGVSPEKTLDAIWSTEQLYVVHFEASTGGTITRPSVTSNNTTDEFTCKATPSDGNSFDGWYRGSTLITTNATITGNIYQNNGVTFTAVFTIGEYTVNFAASPTTAGSVSQESITVPSGTRFTTEGSTLTIGSTTIYANAAEGYTFDQWTPFSEGYITSNRTITANFKVATYHTVTIEVWPYDTWGSTNHRTLTVVDGTLISQGSYTNVITIGSTTVRADAEYDCDFISWSKTSGIINSDMTIHADFVKNHEWYLNTTYDREIGPGSYNSSSSGTIPGITFTTSGNVTYSSGYPMGAGTFDITLFDPSAGGGQATYRFLIFSDGTYYTITFAVEPAGAGTVSTEEMVVENGTRFRASGSRMQIGQNMTYVTTTTTAGFTFSEWSPNDGYVYNSDITITATFTGGTTYTLTFDVSPSEGGSILPHQSISVASGTAFYSVGPDMYVGDTWIEARENYGYAFDRWSETEGTIMDNMTITAYFEYVGACTITFSPMPSDGGRVSVNTLTVRPGTEYHVENNGIRFYSGASYAYPNDGYTFTGWYEGSTKLTSGTVENDMDISAYFRTSQILTDVWWSNGYANNKITVVLDFEQTMGNLTHKMYIPLIQYNASITEPVDGKPRYFELTGDTLEIECAYNSKVKVTIGNYTTTYNPGIWQRYALVIDTQTSKMTFQGISSSMRNPTSEFNFMSYTPVTNVVIADWSVVTTDKAIYRIYHEDTGTGTNHVRFQANATATFLDTYGFVMIDPRINIGDYFPDYDNIRLNLYSFALYGDTITFNNKTYAMDGSQITIRYEEVYEGGKHYVATPTGSKSFTTTLSNVYITWQNLHSTVASERQCYLTFVDDRMTFEMGTYALGDLWVSGVGMWYFTTAVWSPYTAYEKDFTMDWNSPFNISADGFILIFIAIAVIALVAMNVIWKPTFLDYAVVVGGCIISYMMLGFIW